MLSPESIAALRGYPATLFGFTPAEEGYWQEPGMPFQPASEALPPSTDPAAPWRMCVLTTDYVAPRFPKGCRVGLTPVREGQTFYAGVYVWPHLEQGPGLAYVGRLHREGRYTSRLTLMLDNDAQMLTCRLEWKRPGFALYRVTSYLSVAAE